MADGPYFALSCDVHPSGQYFLTTHNGFTNVGCQVRIWDRRMGKIINELLGHTEAVHMGKFLPSYNNTNTSLLIATTSKDCSIRCWDGNITGTTDVENNPANIVTYALSPFTNPLCLTQYAPTKSTIADQTLQNEHSLLAVGNFTGVVGVYDFDHEQQQIQLLASS